MHLSLIIAEFNIDAETLIDSTTYVFLLYFVYCYLCKKSPRYYMVIVFIVFLILYAYPYLKGYFELLMK